MPNELQELFFASESKVFSGALERWLPYANGLFLASLDEVSFVICGKQTITKLYVPYNYFSINEVLHECIEFLTVNQGPEGPISHGPLET